MSLDAQAMETLGKIGHANYKLANELLDQNRELRVTRSERDRLAREVTELKAEKVELEADRNRLDAENARLARQILKLSAPVDLSEGQPGAGDDDGDEL